MSHIAVTGNFYGCGGSLNDLYDYGIEVVTWCARKIRVLTDCASQSFLTMQYDLTCAARSTLRATALIGSRPLQNSQTFLDQYVFSECMTPEDRKEQSRFLDLCIACRDKSWPFQANAKLHESRQLHYAQKNSHKVTFSIFYLKNVLFLSILSSCFFGTSARNMPLNHRNSNKTILSDARYINIELTNQYRYIYERYIYDIYPSRSGYYKHVDNNFAKIDDFDLKGEKLYLRSNVIDPEHPKKNFILPIDICCISTIKSSQKLIKLNATIKYKCICIAPIYLHNNKNKYRITMTTKKEPEKNLTTDINIIKTKFRLFHSDQFDKNNTLDITSSTTHQLSELDQSITSSSLTNATIYTVKDKKKDYSNAIAQLLSKIVIPTILFFIFAIYVIFYCLRLKSKRALKLKFLLLITKNINHTLKDISIETSIETEINSLFSNDANNKFIISLLNLLTKNSINDPYQNKKSLISIINDLSLLIRSSRLTINVTHFHKGYKKIPNMHTANENIHFSNDYLKTRIENEIEILMRDSNDCDNELQQFIKNNASEISPVYGAVDFMYNRYGAASSYGLNFYVLKKEYNNKVLISLKDGLDFNSPGFHINNAKKLLMHMLSNSKWHNLFKIIFFEHFFTKNNRYHNFNFHYYTLNYIEFRCYEAIPINDIDELHLFNYKSLNEQQILQLSKLEECKNCNSYKQEIIQLAKSGSLPFKLYIDGCLIKKITDLDFDLDFDLDLIINQLVTEGILTKLSNAEKESLEKSNLDAATYTPLCEINDIVYKSSSSYMTLNYIKSSIKIGKSLKCPITNNILFVSPSGYCPAGMMEIKQAVADNGELLMLVLGKNATETALEIVYNIYPSYHSSGPVLGIVRTAYLPNNTQGRKIANMMQTAFKKGLTFCVQNSISTGQKNVVVWNDIHHKTSKVPNDTYGYPDEGYLERVKEELENWGIKYPQQNIFDDQLFCIVDNQSHRRSLLKEERLKTVKSEIEQEIKKRSDTTEKIVEHVCYV